MKAILALEDGTIFTGTSFGATGTVTGEACFNTAMGGYQELLTDPANRGQIIAMTYPQIGNYGICEDDHESSNVQVRGFVIGELSRIHSNLRATEPLADWLKRHGVLAIEGIDTRRIARILSTTGTQRACLTTELSESEAVACACAAAPNEGNDFVSEVSTAETYEWREEAGHDWKLPSKMTTDGSSHADLPDIRYNIVAYDFGIRRNILRCLRRSGFNTTVVPAATSAEDVLALNPDGVLLSSGPGDPAALPGIVAEVTKLIGKLPLFGISLGMQLLVLACGGKTSKLKYGHHGCNHPVKEVATGKVDICTLNHTYTADADSLPAHVEVTHVNLNDGTVEGIRLTNALAAGVQFLPAAAPGPIAAATYFDTFASLIDTSKAGK